MIPRDDKKKKKKSRTPNHGGHDNFPPKSLWKDELLKANGKKGQQDPVSGDCSRSQSPWSWEVVFP